MSTALSQYIKLHEHRKFFYCTFPSRPDAQQSQLNSPLLISCKHKFIRKELSRRGLFLLIFSVLVRTGFMALLKREINFSSANFNAFVHPQMNPIMVIGTNFNFTRTVVCLSEANLIFRATTFTTTCNHIESQRRTVKYLFLLKKKNVHRR